ncbi:MAG TPA: primase-helicase family protein, partial [Allocoleopsis sp.]
MPIYGNDLFNQRKLQYIIENWETIPLPEECKRDWKVLNHLTGKTFEVNPISTLTQFYSLRKKIKGSKDIAYVPVSYHQSVSAEKNKYKKGRQYVKDALGLQSFNHIIRNTICCDLYDDIDVVNCHSNILSQLCRKKGWTCKYIDYYNENREECLKSMMELSGKTRKECKTDVIIAMYNNGKVSGYYGLKWFDEFKANIQYIQDEMAKDVEFEEEKAFAIKKNKNKPIEKQNVLGSLCSLIMNQYENDILIQALSFIISKGWNTDNVVRAFDGFMYNKGFFTESVMKELEDWIFKQTGWRIQYLIKPMTEKIELPDGWDIDDEKIMNDDDCEGDVNLRKCKDYKILKKTFEKEVFKIQKPCMFYVKRSDGEYVIMSSTGLIDSYKDVMFINDKGKEDSFVSKWLKDGDKKSFEYECFDPSMKVPYNVFNMFDGFQAEKLFHTVNCDFDYEKIDLISLYVKMPNIMTLLDYLFKNDRDYFLKWCANIIQNPTEKTQVAIMLHTEKGGAGKSLILNWLGYDIIGYYKVSCDPVNDWFGRFSDISNTLLILGEEAKGKDIVPNMDKLKSMITEIKAKKEIKNISGIQSFNNYASFAFSTNNDNPIKIPYGDRRFACFDCNHDKIQDKEFFNDVVKEMEDNLNKVMFYLYLKQLDLSGIHFQNDRPMTEYYQELKRVNIPNWAKFLSKYVDSNEYPDCIKG